MADRRGNPQDLRSGGIVTGDYLEFLAQRRQHTRAGFEPLNIPDVLFDFQRELASWAIRQGRAGIFADCGMGKTLIQLTWARNVLQHTGKSVLILTPLAVSFQTEREAARFHVDDVVRSRAGEMPSTPAIVVTNYEQLEKFHPDPFGGVVCDESSILKNFNGIRRGQITEFLRRVPYRLLCTATAAPNDYIELGNSSEALGEMGYMDMLTRFFRKVDSFVRRGQMGIGQWRFKGHAQEPFWRWVCSWARACRKPSDLGFDDDGFILPALQQTEHLIRAAQVRDGYLFDLPAQDMREEREERRRTIGERCNMAARLVAETDGPSLVWCHLNAEGDRLVETIPNAVQVTGSDPTEKKEETLLAFQAGEIPVLVTKPKIGAWGLNLQGCAHVVFFADHSYESYYQGVRRCWRFGQSREVLVDVIATEGQRGILANLRRKATQADEMFSALVRFMREAEHLEIKDGFTKKEDVPTWVSKIRT